MAGPGIEPSSGPGLPRVQAAVRAWRDELIDLSGRNKLINLGNRGVLRIAHPSPSEVLDGLAFNDDGWRFHYPPLSTVEAHDDALRAALHAEDDELSDEVAPDELVVEGMSASRLSGALRGLERRSSTEWNDKGLRVLYLALGGLSWEEAPGERRLSPLLLVPVALERDNPREPFRLRPTDEDWAVNPALAVKLAQDFGIAWGEYNDDLTLDDVLEQVRLRVKSRPGWEVVDLAAVATLSFAKEAMYRDLDANEAQICEHPLVRALTGEHRAELDFVPVVEEQLDALGPPEEIPTVRDADATQRQCIMAAREGRSFVMEGPPGTGKSQTISNMIAELLRLGRSVLFVSEKAAALDVVKNRLDDAGLGTFVLELHSSKATRKEVAAELGRALQERPRAAKAFSDDDAHELKRARELLSAYAWAMNEERDSLGMTLHEVLGRLAKLDAVVRAPVPGSVDETLTADRYRRARDAAARLGRSWGPVARGDDFLWQGLADPDRARARSASLREEAEAALAAASALDDCAAQLAGDLQRDTPSTDEAIVGLQALAAHVAARPDVPASWLTGPQLDLAAGAVARVRPLVEERAARAAALDASSPGWQDLSAGLKDELFAARQAAQPLRLPPELPIGNLAGVSVAVRECSARHRELAELGRDVEDRLGLAARPLTAQRLGLLAELCGLAGGAHRPESSWLGADGLRDARAALAFVRPLLDQYRTLNAQVLHAFADHVGEFDVEALFDGEHDQVPKLGRFGARGRNRRQLQAVTRPGRTKAEAVAALPALRAWRRTLAAIRTTDAASRQHLGPVYWQQERTDFEAVDLALSAAARAISLLDDDLPPQARSVLALDAIDGERLVALGQRLVHLRDSRLAPLIGALTEGLVGQLHSAAADAAVDRCDAVVDALERLQAVLAVAQLCLRPGLTLGEVDAAADGRAAVASLDERLETEGLQAGHLLGQHWQGLDTDWAVIEGSLHWAAALRALHGGTLSARYAQHLLDASVDPQPLRDAADRYATALEALLGEFTPERRALLRADLAASCTTREDLLRALVETVGDVDEWQAYVAAVADLEAGKLGRLVAFCREQRVRGGDVADVVDKAILTAYADAVFAADARLQPLQAKDRDALVDAFRRLDKEATRLAAARVIEACNRRRPSSTVGEVKVIYAEANKKRKHRPIRQLLSEAGKAAQALKPCFMMSPLSVSQFLPPSLRFDAVIFDEASQIRPCDGANAIYRGSQLIVAGDDKQLPPTSFFQLTDTGDDDEWDEDTPDTYESILGLCRASAQLPALPLRWHYRSRHEALITYSNRMFYDSRLVTYPGALDDSPDVGVALYHVPDGVYGRGHSKDNPVEARKVVERVAYHADHHPHLSVGVVAFSEPQATRISIELEGLRRQRPDLDGYFTERRLDGFFVKNLENVQGDERDIIIFSVGYARDEHGKLTMNFGPLNRDGGHRRLNVAVTRARQRVELVTSITASDFTETASFGVQCLKAYIDYASRGLAALAPATHTTQAEPESPFEEEVLATISRWGFVAEPQVGHLGYRIDIGVRRTDRPGQWALGVECDGAAYHSSKVARDRDRLRQEVLEGLGWHLYRIWGPAWYRDRPQEERKLRAAIEAAVTGTRPARVREGPPPLDVVMETTELDAAPAWTVPYEPYRHQGGQRYQDMSLPTSVVALEADIHGIVRAEGPITIELVRHRLRSIWAQQNITAKRLSRIDEAIGRLVARGAVQRVEAQVVALPGQDHSVVRRADGERREKASHVPSFELRNAMRGVCRDAHSIDEDELTARTAAIFGWQRRGPEIQVGLEVALGTLVDRGELVRTPDGRYSTTC